ncbi:S49 family peptidase [Escherichia coli]|uniref:S49 family peptidase n=1 Tax=Enterobacter sp. JMULE2 TaxID=2518340 RepID=UPI0015753CAC|nr:S49 family peptidase [Enterobacter sp. JMULE2]NTZ41044.1 S49 family peptidase [Enterobacter sp. JMULE2]
MFKHNKETPASLKQAFNHQANRFYGMFRVSATAKIAMSGLAIIAVGYSFYNLYDQYQENEGLRDHFAVIRLTGEMSTGSDTGDGTVIATALGKAYRNPHAKAIIIEAESGGGSPSDAITIYRQINALRSHQQKISVEKYVGGRYVSDDEVDVPKPPESFSQQKRKQDELEKVKANTLSIIATGQGTFIKDARYPYKPIIVSVKSICASACYYAVSPADAIYADNNALIGSIGVRMDHWDVSQVMKTIGLKNEPLIAGENKDSLDPYHPMSEKTRDFMQTQILDNMHKQFIADVEQARANKILSPSDAESVALYSGRVWPTPTAIKYGLIDADVTPVEVRSRLSAMYGIQRFKNYNEPQRNLRSALGMLASLTTSVESLTQSASKLADSVDATSHPKLR